jgi:hypothetical protein
MKSLLVALVLLAVSASFGACANVTAIPAPTSVLRREVGLRVLPKAVRPGMRALFVGWGFEGGEPLAFYLIRPDGTQTPEGSSTADKDGGAAYEVEVTDDWLPGQYVAHVRSKRNPTRRAEQKFELGPR